MNRITEIQMEIDQLESQAKELKKILKEEIVKDKQPKFKPLIDAVAQLLRTYYPNEKYVHLTVYPDTSGSIANIGEDGSHIDPKTLISFFKDNWVDFNGRT